MTSCHDNLQLDIQVKNPFHINQLAGKTENKVIFTLLIYTSIMKIDRMAILM